MGRDPKKREFSPQGPFSPPTPSEAEQTEGEPMAVAQDKQTSHGEGFVPTTASSDQFDPEVARRYRDPNMRASPGHGAHGGASPTPHGARAEGRSDENRRMESPAGYTSPDEGGRTHPKDEPE